MKRQIISVKGYNSVTTSPGFSQYPNCSYKSRRSKKARSRDKKVEHQHARSVLKRDQEVNDE